MSDSIDRLLRDDAGAAIADNGFTARVMGALPARKARADGSFRTLLVFGSAALGCLLAVVLSPQGGSLAQGFGDLVQLPALTPAAVAALALCGALLASALVLALEPD